MGEYRPVLQHAIDINLVFKRGFANGNTSLVLLLDAPVRKRMSVRKLLTPGALSRFRLKGAMVIRQSQRSVVACF